MVRLTNICRKEIYAKWHASMLGDRRKLNTLSAKLIGKIIWQVVGRNMGPWKYSECNRNTASGWRVWQMARV